MVDKKVLENNKYLKEDYLIEDYSLWLRIGLKGKLKNLPDYSIEYLVNESGQTQKHNLLQTKNSLFLIKKYKKLYPKNRC